MRSVVYSLLADHVPFTTIVPADRLLGTSSMEQAPDTKPFAMLRFGPILPGVGAAVTRSATLWVHDNPGSYLRIEEALRAARNALDVQQIQTDRGWLMSAEWTGESDDLVDDVYRTIVRNATWRLVGTGE